MVAAYNGRVECVDLLIAHGASVNQQNEDGWTALYRAAESGRTNCVDSLLRAGADPNKKTTTGVTAADVSLNADIKALILAAKSTQQLKIAKASKADVEGEMEGQRPCKKRRMQLSCPSWSWSCSWHPWSCWSSFYARIVRSKVACAGADHRQGQGQGQDGASGMRSSRHSPKSLRKPEQVIEVHSKSIDGIQLSEEAIGSENKSEGKYSIGELGENRGQL